MNSIAIQERRAVLGGIRGSVFQLGMLSAAAVLPAVCHFAGAPVQVLLPMHWPVIAAGLFCGWRAGLTAGLISPLITFALSGMPSAAYLPPMTLELAVYGFAAGFAFERLSLRPVSAVALALLAGRVVYIAAASLSAPLTAALAGLLPGIPAALAQAALLPLAHGRLAGQYRE